MTEIIGVEIEFARGSFYEGSRANSIKESHWGEVKFKACSHSTSSPIELAYRTVQKNMATWRIPQMVDDICSITYRVMAAFNEHLGGVHPVK